MPVRDRGVVTVQADGTRMHDEKVESDHGVRWISWREVSVRSDSGTEVQGVGRDVTSRVEAEQALTLARNQAEAASRTKSRFLATVSASEGDSESGFTYGVLMADELHRAADIRESLRG